MTIETPCREYQGQRTPRGYGVRSRVPCRRWGTKYMHRQVMAMVGVDQYGTVFDPDSDQVVMHECDNPSCFRYDHLRIGADNRENWDDMRAKGRHVVPVPRTIGTHCPSGHAYTPENTYTDSQGRARCRACSRESNRRAWANGGAARQRAYRQRRRQEG